MSGSKLGGSNAGAGPVQDWHDAVVKGEVNGSTFVHKFGAATIGTSIVPITVSGFYRTPTGATAIEVVSDSSEDSATGSGARAIEVQGLDASWNHQVATAVPDGATGVVLQTAGATAYFTRIYRWEVTSSGTYATQTAGSHAGQLDLQTAGTTAVWSSLKTSPFPQGQSEIGCYTVPAGYKAYLHSKNVFVSTTANKEADIYFFKRDNIDDVTAPYSGIMKLVQKEIGIQGGFELSTDAAKYLGEGPMDIGFMGIATATSDVSVEFEVEIVKV